MVYLVTYDLNKVGQNYNGLIEAIKSFTFTKVMQSAWMIESRLSSSQVFEVLKKFIDRNDTILIEEISVNRAGRLNQSVWDFMRR